MYYECRKCNRRFEELQALGKVKFCGDFWKCTDCNHDITKDLESWFKEVNEMTDILWNATSLVKDEEALVAHNTCANSMVDIRNVDFNVPTEQCKI